MPNLVGFAAKPRSSLIEVAGRFAKHDLSEIETLNMTASGMPKYQTSLLFAAPLVFFE
jgi:hypothetical protein